jgi:hypothetical protein
MPSFVKTIITPMATPEQGMKRFFKEILDRFRYILGNIMEIEKNV